ncbi:MAG: S8 family serine peptidase [Candidatus Aminicenantes bacterium]|nr:S8 family serine peptidase [Candidatus Aminicenantes bacterium]
MKINPGKRVFCLLAVLMGAAVLVLVPGMALVRQDAPPPSEAPPLSAEVEKGDPKIEHALFMFHKIFQTQGLEKAREFAEHRRMDLEDDRVLVLVESHASPAAEMGGDPVPFIMGQIAFLGGDVKTRYEGQVEARMPAAGLLELAANPLVKFVRLPLKPQPLAVTSEGVSLTGANLWHDLEPYRTASSGLKVCILDLGFKDYASLLGTELPSSVRTRSFRTDGNLSAGSVHGTACAEIVHDMAPDAELYLVNFSTELQHRQAVDWLISEGVDVISYSIAWFNAGDGRGTGPICEPVKKASDNGILWAAAAGNYAEDHWEGTYYTSDGDWWHNFDGADEILQFYVPAYTPVGAFLNWDDWGYWNGTSYGGSDQDYDLELYIWTGSYWYYVDGSYGWQSGSQWPTEAIGYWQATLGAYWGVAIYEWNATRNCKLELFIGGNSSAIEFCVPEGSITVPADSPHIIAVGATDAVSDNYHSYSSLGPTHDGRIKPDFCAPSGVSTATYGTRNFYGTSTCGPHMAGGLALMKGMTPYSWSQVRTILEERAVDKGDPGKDNRYGIGRLNLKR